MSGYGTYAVSSGTWTYTLDNSDSTVNALDSGSTAITDTFVVTSADGNTQATITVTISGANDAPTISSSAVTTATEDTAYTYTVTAADVDSGETLTMTGTTVPGWATFTASTGVLAGTPLNADVGANSVVITVSDGTASVTDSFTITVANANDAPTITSSAVLTATEDSAYTYTVTAADVDSGDTVTLTGTTVPGWATFTAVSYTHLTLPTILLV